MRFLVSPRHGMYVFETPELTLVGYAFFRPQSLNHRDAFIKHRSTVLHVEPIGRILFGNECAPETDIEASITDIVQHREFARQLDRMIEGGDNRSGDRAIAARSTIGLGECPP